MDKATANLTVVSPLHNLSLGDIADELGSVKAQSADLKAREDALKAELIGCGATVAEGALFRCTITEATRWTLDADRIRQDMGEAWCSARSKVSSVTTLRVSARSGTRKAA